jgi:hypothetical protein
MDEDWSEDILEKLALLGEPTAEFAVRGRRLFRNLVLAPLLILAGVGIDVLVFSIGHGGHLAKLVVLGIFLIIMGIMLVVRALRNRGLRVLLFPEGIVRVLRGEVETLFWDEIDQVIQTKNDHSWARAWQGPLVFIVQRKDRAVHFDDALPRLKELGAILHRETLPQLLARARAECQAGRSLQFGKLRLSRLGITQDNDTLAWEDIQTIKLEEDEVTFQKKDKWSTWFRGTVSDIPNFHVFRVLVPELRNARATPTAKENPDATAAD